MEQKGGLEAQAPKYFPSRFSNLQIVPRDSSSEYRVFQQIQNKAQAQAKLLLELERMSHPSPGTQRRSRTNIQ